MTDEGTFGEELRRALNHLHEPEILRTSPLVRWLAVEAQEDCARALRIALEQAIEAFRPASDPGPDSREWRRYEVLSGRYGQGLTQESVAGRLGITPRHLRREQAMALQALAGYLRLLYDLPVVPEGGPAHEISPGSQGNVEINREMLWLADSLRDGTSEVEPALREAMDLVQALAQQRAISLSLSCSSAIPLAGAPQTVLRQIVLNLVTAAIRNLSPGGRVRLFAQVEAEGIAIIVTASPCSQPTWECLKTVDTAAEMSRRLVELFEGKLVLSELGGILVARVILPLAGRRVIVLAIEDNTDTLQLWRRYLQGTLFTLVEETDPQQALIRAAALHPDLIILDVMLPNIDGWALLRRLRSDPSTASTPIVVCTVLPQKELALSLGASDFIQKPATGREFRAVLDRQIVAAARP